MFLRAFPQRPEPEAACRAVHIGYYYEFVYLSMLGCSGQIGINTEIEDLDFQLVGINNPEFANPCARVLLNGRAAPV